MPGHGDPNAKVAVETTCVFCKTERTVLLDEFRYLRWVGGESLLTAFPDMSADYRELLISGTCPECWDLHMSDVEYADLGSPEGEDEGHD